MNVFPGTIALVSAISCLHQLATLNFWARASSENRSAAARSTKATRRNGFTRLITIATRDPNELELEGLVRLGCGPAREQVLQL